VSYGRYEINFSVAVKCLTVARVCCYIVLLPVFQVQVLICTGDSGSNPERALYRWICWLEMIKKENRKRYEGCYGIETLEAGQNIRELSSW